MPRPTPPPREVWRVLSVPHDVSPMIAAVDESHAVTCIHFGNDARECAVFAARHGAVLEKPDSKASSQISDELADYLAGRLQRFESPLRLLGTDFQKRVWQALREIEFGAVRTYGELAQRLGQPGAARAVGMAAGANQLVIAVPCHRLVAGGNKLGGFTGAVATKRWLLAHEAQCAGRPRAYHQIELPMTAMVLESEGGA